MLQNCTSRAALENATSEFECPIPEPDNPDNQTLADALRRDPVAIARNIVNTVQSSQLRREEFKEVIEYGNQRLQWEDKHGHRYQIAVQALIRDSPLRWGSTFLMISWLLLLRSVSLFSLFTHVTNTLVAS